MDINDILKERGKSHGQFKHNADTAQGLKDVLRANPNWATLPATHKEALDMIAHKMSRAVSGGNHHVDTWVDIEGYARLVSQAERDIL